MERLTVQAEMLQNRVRKTARHLKKWARREGVTCYRLYDCDIPEVPLCIDDYEGRLHVAEYAGPEAEDPGRIDVLAQAAAAALEIPPESVFIKRRERQRGERQYERVATNGARFVVGEGGHCFLVNLSDYLDTGLFLDHRTTRALVAAEAADKRVLNLFAYTGSFTVYTLAAGAAEATTVDMSATYLDWAAENLRLNGLEGRRHRFVRDDALSWLRASSGERFDLVVVDPPTFSNSKRMEGTFDVQRDHAALLRAVLAVTAPGGVVWFSTNARRFKLDAEALVGTQVEELSAKTVPPDFRDKRIHRSFRIVRS